MSSRATPTPSAPLSSAPPGAAGGFQSPFSHLMASHPPARVATPPNAFAALQAGQRSLSLPIGAGNGSGGGGGGGGFTSPFSALSSSPQATSAIFPLAQQTSAAADQSTNTDGNSTLSINTSHVFASFPGPPGGVPAVASSTSTGFPTAQKIVSAFPPPRFGSNHSPSSSLSFPAPSFGFPSPSPSSSGSFPSSRLNSSPPSRTASAGPSSAAQSKSASPMLVGARGDIASFPPLGAAGTASVGKGSVGVFSALPTANMPPTAVPATNAAAAAFPKGLPPSSHIRATTDVSSRAVAPAAVQPVPLSGVHLDAATMRPDQLISLPALIPPFPESLRATECSTLAHMLAPDGLTPLEPVQPAPAYFTGATVSPSTRPRRRANGNSAAFNTLLDSLRFSLAELVLESAATSASGESHVFADGASSSTVGSAALKPFDFSAPSPDDIVRARLQAIGAPSRALTTDAPSMEQAAERALRRKLVKGTGGRLARDDDDEEDEEDESFLYATDRRARIGGMLSLSTGSVGAAVTPAVQLATTSHSVFVSRPFSALYASLVALKRAALDDLFRGASIAALLLQQVVREPRRRDTAKHKDAPGETPAAAPTGVPAAALASIAAAQAADVPSFAVAEEVFTAKGASSASAVVSSFTPSTLPYQIVGMRTATQQAKARAIEDVLATVTPETLPASLRTLYERKLKVYQSSRLALPVSTAPLAEQAVELVTPTPMPAFLPSLASLNMLVVGAPHSGVSTLLGNLLYQLGRLPFALVKPKHAPADYWEQFNGQQRIGGVATNDANAKHHAFNARKYDFRAYTHAFYTNRYRVNVLHDNMGGIPRAQAVPATADARPTPPTPQQTNLSLLAALQADFVLLVVDASPGASFTSTPLMQQQLLAAYMAGARQVVLALTKLDAGNAAFSEKRVQAVIASVVSSCLKPLGFASHQVVTIPVSGLTGENLLTRQSRDLAAWYDGPTLHQLVDRVTLPMHRQVETVADRRLCMQVVAPPEFVGSILNEETLDAVRVRVQVLSGLLLHSEPVALVGRAASRGPVGPVGMRALDREECTDARDIAVYEDDPIEESAATDATSSKSAPVKKVTHDATGKKLTNAERKDAQAAAKREHARQAAKEKQQRKKGAWNQQEWSYHQEEPADEEESIEESAPVVLPSAAAAVATPPSTALVTAPLLSPGDVGVLTLTTLRSPATNSDDDLKTLLTGRNIAEITATHSADALAYIARHAQPGDMLTLPVDGTEGLRSVTAFRAEVLALTTWPADLQLKAGQGVTLVPLRATLPSPAAISHTSPASLWSLLCPPPSRAAPLGSGIVIMDRLVNVLNKSSRAVLRKKPEYLCGPTVDRDGIADAAGQLATVEFSSSRPLVIDAFQHGGPRLANCLLVHQEQVIALVNVTGVMTYA